MASFTLTTNARQDRGIAWYRARVNAERAAQTPPLGPVTAAQILNARADEMLNSWADQAEEEARNADDVKALRNAYVDATPAVQAQVKTLLGVS